MENERYLNDLKSNTNDAINYQLIEVRRAIGKNSYQSIKSFEKLTNYVCGTLESGFSHLEGELKGINWTLNDINEGIGNLHLMLDWKLDLLLEGQKITNLYLGKIIQILKIPDSQMQRGYHVEQGLTYLKNAIIEGSNSDFFSDAYDELIKAKNIEEKDYFCLHKLGIIHLNSLKHLDIKKADEYFRLAARYSKAAALVAPKNNNSSHKYEVLTESQLLIETASAFIFASKANYILDNKLESIKLAQQAVELQPENLDYKIHLAKCFTANGQDHIAAIIIVEVIKIDKNYSVKILTDADFVSKSIILNEIELLAQKLINQIQGELDYLNSILNISSIAKADFFRVQSIFSPTTYLNAREVEKELASIKSWTYTHYENDFFEKDHYRLPVLEKKSINTSISQIIRIEKEEKGNKKAYDINIRIARELINARIRKREGKEQLINFVKLLVVLIILITTWNFSSSMDGWFNKFLIRASTLLGAVVAVGLIFKKDLNL
ncbi:MAG TPA: hypothetical protein VIM70_18320 [Clostridium sp.]|uniref:hypothetical protein n=1 Tax=Clostridium sp. TaxID=1506 RepID=UPI002F95510B